MKKYIKTISLAFLGVFCSTVMSAQDANVTDSATIKVPFGMVSENRLVGSVETINGEDLQHTAERSVSGAIDGLTSGYVASRIRGYSRGGDEDSPLIIIDGLSNRTLAQVTVEEIESIEILKDVTAKMLYGSKAANGVIVVTTKRGKAQKRKISFDVEYGYRNLYDTPDYLGTADYMKYRNQALKNDGKALQYNLSNAEIDSLVANNQIGTNEYPETDYYDMFINDYSSYVAANAQLQGGDEKTRYFFNVGYQGNTGWEKVGDKSKDHTFNVRSNLDYNVNDVVSVKLDIAGQFTRNNYNGVGTSKLFSTASSTLPNEYPMFIGNSRSVDSLGTKDGSNFYGDMLYSGYVKNETSFATTNIGMKFDLNDYVKGLTAQMNGSFDIDNYISEGKKLTYTTLKPDVNNPDSFIVNGVYQPKGNESKFADSYYRNMGGDLSVNYNREFGKNAIDATLSYSLTQKSVKTEIDDINTIMDDKNMNVGFRANYAYDNKYVAEIASSYMGSNRLSKDNRWKLYNSFGLSYVLSQEDFIKDLGFIDYLKLKTSYGKMGYDQSIEYMKYVSLYKPWSGSYAVGLENSGDKLVGTEFSQSGNEDLTFEEAEEFNIGVDLRVLDNRLALNAEYYTEDRTGMPIEMKANISSLAGDPSFYDNYNEIKNKGCEVSLQWTDQVNDFSYSFGGKLSHFVSEYGQYDELNDFSFQNNSGTKTDAIWGYVSDGFYTTSDEVEAGIPSALGTVIPGDLKYKDLSNTHEDYNEQYGDTIINSFDKKIIGHSRPRLYYSLNLNLKYKNFSLYALGTGATGYQRTYSWNKYYTNQGSSVKYSKFAADAAVPTFDANGKAVGLENNDFKYPRLTTEGSANSYQSSTYFMYDAWYFTLSTVEFDYTFPKSITDAISANKLDVFVRGDNLVKLSQEKDMDDDYPTCGTSWPSYSTVAVGFKLIY